jgi:hypothetical protein
MSSNHITGNYIRDLISRMSDDSYRSGEKKIHGNYESEKTVSWSAYNEARQLNNPEIFNELCLIIESTENEEIKHHAYFILGHNAKNAGDLNTTKYLLKKLREEKSKTILVTILDRLSDLYKPKGLDTDKKLKVSKEFVQSHLDKIDKLTRPG